jgi:hypothetical protein
MSTWNGVPVFLSFLFNIFFSFMSRKPVCTLRLNILISDKPSNIVLDFILRIFFCSERKPPNAQLAAGSGGAGGGKFGSSTTEDSPTGKPPLLGQFFRGKERS